MQKEFTYENLEIIVEFSSGVVFTKNPFDAVLASLYAQKLKREGKYEQYGDKLIELPFVKQTNGIYHTSYPIVVDEACFLENTVITKKIDEKLYNEFSGGKSKKFDITRGAFVSSVVNFEKSLIQKIKFYVCGDIDYISELLQNFTHYGKKSSIGFGKVKNITINVIEEDYSLIGENGEANRILPSDNFSNVKNAKKALKRPIFPYQERDLYTVCYV